MYFDWYDRAILEVGHEIVTHVFPVDPNNSGDYPVDCFRSYDARPDINISDPSWLHEGNSLDLFPDLKQTVSMGCPLVEPSHAACLTQPGDIIFGPWSGFETVTTKMSRPSGGEKDDVNGIEMKLKLLKKKMKFSYELEQM